VQGSLSCLVLDLLLSGSLPATSITEIAGKSASGKTQLYLQLALLVPLSLLSASSHFLHSDIPFPFCSLRCLTPTSHPDILNHVLIATAHSPAELLSLLTYAQCVLAHPNLSPHRLTIRLNFDTSPADLRGRSIVVTNQVVDMVVDTVAWQSGIGWPYFILAQGAKLSVQVYAGG
jgi:DNA-repair protein XRCC3